LPLEQSDLVAQVLDGFFELLETLLLEVEDRQQALDQRRSFGCRDRGKLNPHISRDGTELDDLAAGLTAQGAMRMITSANACANCSSWFIITVAPCDSRPNRTARSCSRAYQANSWLRAAVGSSTNTKVGLWTMARAKATR